MVRMLAEMTLGDFSARIGEAFRIALPDGPIELTLVEAEGIGRKDHAGPRRAPFSLVFRGPMKPALVQRTWPLEHVAFGVLDVFLVPIGPDASGMRYEAVFN